ncbi:conjugal transfer protein [Bacteroidia bacterium]|nr:conjugal transfer protein [Bacteroidia bacterium]
MKKTLSYFLYTMLIACIVCACSDSLDIVQDYGYRVETLPLPKSLKKGETVALEFSIVREGHYEGAEYRFRFFQSEGEGILSYKGKILPVNRFQEIKTDNFILTYTNSSDEQVQLDFVFEDSFNRRMEYSIAFAGSRTEKEPEG